MGCFSQKSNGKKRKQFVILLSVILAVILTGSLALYLIYKPDSDQRSNTLREEGDALTASSVSGQTEAVLHDKDCVNILLLGQDCLEYDEDSLQYTEAIIMCTINKKTGTLTLTSFAEDLWVYIPGHYNQRLHAPYMLGGFPLLNKTLDYNFGISPDYNVEIDFAGFMKVIDILGGVEIPLTDAEAKYLNNRGNWDVEANQNWQLTEGTNLLTGSQALAYSRIRQIGTDFGRTHRQRMILTALVEKIQTMGGADLFDLSRKLLPLIRTDMSENQVLSMIAEMLPLFAKLEVVSQRIPLDQQYTFAEKSGMDVIVMNMDQMKANKELIAATMGK